MKHVPLYKDIFKKLKIQIKTELTRKINNKFANHTIVQVNENLLLASNKSGIT